jgi:hypothetical protein
MLTVALMLAAGVALAIAGWDVSSIIGLLAAVGAAAGSGTMALSKVVTVDERAQHIDERTATIERQTNGEMTATIHKAVRAAVAEHLGDHKAAVRAAVAEHLGDVKATGAAKPQAKPSPRKRT